MKKLIKRLSLLICVLALLSGVQSVCAVSENVWDFEDYAGNTVQDAKEYLEGKGFYYVSGTQNIVQAKENDKMLEIGSGSRWVMWAYPDRNGLGTPIAEDFVLELDFMQKEKSAVKDIATPSTYPWHEENYACKIDSDGEDLRLYYKKGILTIVENYQTNTVYNIKIAHTLEDHTLKVWVNDVALFTDVTIEFMNTVSDVSRFDYNNTSGTGSIYIGEMSIYPYADVTDELETLKNTINEAKAVYHGLESGEHLGQCTPSVYEVLENTLATAEKNYRIWENTVLNNAAQITDITEKLSDAAKLSEESINTVSINMYEMDFDSKTMEDDGWHLIEVTPGTIISDGENKVYQGTTGTRGLRFFRTPFDEKATVSFSFKQNTKAPVSKISEITSYSYTDSNRLFVISSDGTDILINGQVLIENYSAGQWYDIQLDTDPVTKTLKVYVNGVRVLRDVTLPYLGADAYGIGRWETSTVAADSEILIDNIKIYRNCNEEFSAFALGLLDIFGSSGYVTENLTLPTSKDGYIIKWLSSAPDIISTDGEVNRSENENHKLTLTALVSRDGYTYKHTYHLTVPELAEDNSSRADIIIEERTGHDGREFFRRGIPFKQGELFSKEDVCLQYEDGTAVPIQTEVMETYPDGSIEWLSVAFMWDLKANESYNFYIMQKERSAVTSEVLASTSGEVTVLKNEAVEARITKGGITELIVDGQPVLSGDGIRLCVDNSYYFTADTVNIVESGPIFAQVRLTGSFTGSNVTGDWFITVYQGDSRLYHEVKFTAKGDQSLNTETLDISFAEDYITIEYEDDASIDGNIVNSDWVIMTGNGRSIMLTSKDVTRFDGAVADSGVNNGFIFTEGISKVQFAPIQFESPYTWLDGITRTVRLDMSFYNSFPTENEKGRESAWAYTPPSFTIASERFVYTGMLEDNNTSPAITRTERLITSMYGGLWNHFQAGKFPHTLEINYENENIVTIYRGERYESAFNRSGGETEYNLWKSYMNTGTPVLYDLLLESSEYWVDFMIYRGKIDKLTGTNRYQTNPEDLVSFRTNMPFYGDLSGLYMSYCITGDPYYKESFKLAADFWKKSINDSGGLPMLSYWYNNAFPDRLNYNEEFSEVPSYQFRFSAMARGMFYAYSLFGDESYLDAGKSIIDHLPAMQMENGSFYESYYYPSLEPLKNVTDDNGNLCYSEKLYIMNFGARMLADFYNLSGYAPALPVLIKLEDYLATKRGDKGFGWSPNADDEVYAAYTIRGASNSSTEMSFVAKLYQATGAPEYLRTIAEMFRYYTGSWGGGNTDRVMETGKSNFMEVSQTISRMLLDNSDLVAQMGYADVIAVLDAGATERDDLYADFRDKVIKQRGGRLAMNVFDTSMGRVVYLNNCELVTYTAENPTLYKDTAFTMEFCADTDTNLWYGAKNTVEKSGVSVIRDVRVVDMIPLLKTDFSLTVQDSAVTADISTYTSDRIELTLNSADDIPFRLSDGYFSVEDDKCYILDVDGEKTVLWPENGTLCATIPVNNSTVSVAVYKADGISVNIGLYDGDNPIETPEDALGNTVSIKITVVNETSDEIYSTSCIAAVYAGDKLHNVKICAVDAGEGNHSYTISDITLPEDRTNAVVKVFLFENESKLRPKCMPVIFG